jgi:hypothetical protein
MMVGHTEGQPEVAGNLWLLTQRRKVRAINNTLSQFQRNKLSVSLTNHLVSV